jgi:transcriptional regulator with XRE-family HTH domain
MLLDKKYFGNFLARKRSLAGLSQNDLAEKLGYNTGQFVSNWERGTSSPPVDKLPMIAKILRIPAEELIDVIISETEFYLKAHLLNKPGRRSNSGV